MKLEKGRTRRNENYSEKTPETLLYEHSDFQTL